MKSKKFLASFSFLILISLTACENNIQQEVEKGEKQNPGIQIQEKLNQIIEEKTKTTKVQEVQKEIKNLISGTFKENISYKNPEGIDKIILTYTLKDSIIQSVNISEVEVSPTSSAQITNFNTASSKLIGKNISELEGISAIGGASLTTAAFKKALQSK